VEEEEEEVEEADDSEARAGRDRIAHDLAASTQMGLMQNTAIMLSSTSTTPAQLHAQQMAMLQQQQQAYQQQLGQMRLNANHANPGVFSDSGLSMEIGYQNMQQALQPQPLQDVTTDELDEARRQSDMRRFPPAAAAGHNDPQLMLRPDVQSMLMDDAAPLGQLPNLPFVSPSTWDDDADNEHTQQLDTAPLVVLSSKERHDKEKAELDRILGWTEQERIEILAMKPFDTFYHLEENVKMYRGLLENYRKNRALKDEMFPAFVGGGGFPMSPLAIFAPQTPAAPAPQLSSEQMTATMQQMATNAESRAEDAIQAAKDAEAAAQQQAREAAARAQRAEQDAAHISQRYLQLHQEQEANASALKAAAEEIARLRQKDAQTTTVITLSAEEMTKRNQAQEEQARLLLAAQAALKAKEAELDAERADRVQRADSFQKREEAKRVAVESQLERQKSETRRATAQAAATAQELEKQRTQIQELVAQSAAVADVEDQLKRQRSDTRKLAAQKSEVEALLEKQNAVSKELMSQKISATEKLEAERLEKEALAKEAAKTAALLQKQNSVSKQLTTNQKAIEAELAAERAAKEEMARQAAAAAALLQKQNSALVQNGRLAQEDADAALQDERAAMEREREHLNRETAKLLLAQQEIAAEKERALEAANARAARAAADAEAAAAAAVQASRLDILGIIAQYPYIQVVHAGVLASPDATLEDLARVRADALRRIVIHSQLPLLDMIIIASAGMESGLRMAYDLALRDGQDMDAFITLRAQHRKHMLSLISVVFPDPDKERIVIAEMEKMAILHAPNALQNNELFNNKHKLCKDLMQVMDSWFAFMRLRGRLIHVPAELQYELEDRRDVLLGKVIRSHKARKTREDKARAHAEAQAAAAADLAALAAAPPAPAPAPAPVAVAPAPAPVVIVIDDDDDDPEINRVSKKQRLGGRALTGRVAPPPRSCNNCGHKGKGRWGTGLVPASCGCAGLYYCAAQRPQDKSQCEKLDNSHRCI